MVLWQLCCRVGRIVPRRILLFHHLRYSTGASNLPPWSPAASIIQDLESKCNNPVFATVKQLAARDSTAFGQLEPMQVTERDHPDAQEWNWMAVAEAKDFTDSVQRLERAGVHFTHKVLDSFKPEPGAPPPLEATSAPQPPTWLVMHILCNQVETYQDMITALKLVYHHFPAADPAVRPSLLIMTAVRLAQMKIIAPLRVLVTYFLSASADLTAAHFNLLIRAIALAPPSNEVSILATGLVRLSIAKKHPLDEQTYDALLSAAFCSPPVVAAVTDAFRCLHYEPTVYHLRCLLKFCSRYRRTRQAAQYLEQIHDRLGAQAPPHTDTPEAEERGTAAFGITGDNRAYVQAMREPKLAVEYLTRMAMVKARDARLADLEKHSRWPSRTRDRNSPSFTIADWAAGLQVAAQSSTVSPAALLKTFHAGQAAYSRRLNAFAHVVLLRGLLRKWAVKHAVRAWEEYRDPELRLPLSLAAVGLGVKALTLNDQPHRAFQLLEGVRERSSREAEPAARSQPYSVREVHTPFVTLQAVNQFMVALHRVGRGDVVFAIWDNMETLYGFRPDAYSLNILLQAARWSIKYNMTIRGALAHLGVGVERYKERVEDEDAREHAVQWIASILDPDVKHVKHSLWNGQSAPRCALRIATRVLLGNWPRLKDIRSPLKLVPPSSLVRTILRTAPPSIPSPTSPLVLLSEELPENETFQQIVPTDVTFRALLDQLELHNLASEVPLVLAWAKELRIRLSRDTLATALVYWSGVPDAERWGGRQASYRGLYAWLEEWLGEERMPTAEEMTATFRRLYFFNEWTRADMTARRIEVAEMRMRELGMDE